jgi:hypothetical protein
VKTSEEAIGRILAGLRSTDTPVGMERRIREAVQERRSSRSLPGWRWLGPIWVGCPNPIGRGLLVTALTGLLVVALSVPSLYRARKLQDARVSWKTPAGFEGKPQFQRPTLNAGRSPMPGVAFSRAPLINGRARAVRFVHGNDSGVWNTTGARSRPAPSLPLTNEEKVLLRLARNVDLKQLTSLDSEARARQEAESNAKFVEFFGR